MDRTRARCCAWRRPWRPDRGTLSPAGPHARATPGPEATAFAAVAGRGAHADLEGHRYHLGSHRYAEELGVCNQDIERHLRELEANGRTPAILSDGARALGILGLADQLRAEAPNALGELRRLEVGPLVMLTGDVRGTAEE